MLVMSNIDGAFITSDDFTKATQVRKGDVFHIANTTYANDCIASGVCIEVKLATEQAKIALEQPVAVETPELVANVESNPIVEEAPQITVNATQGAIDLANELGIDINHVKSKSGKITVMDIRNYQKDSLV